MFGSSQSSGAPDLIVTSSNSGLQGQEGLDRTAMDIQVFARGGAEVVQQVNVVEDEEIDIDESEEGGVSSIVSSSEGGAGAGGSRQGRSRQAITWGDGSGSSSGSGTTSSSPQRQAATAENIESIVFSSYFDLINYRLELQGEAEELLEGQEEQDREEYKEEDSEC